MQIKLAEKEDIEVETPDVVPTEIRIEIVKESEKAKNKKEETKVGGSGVLQTEIRMELIKESGKSKSKQEDNK